MLMKQRKENSAVKHLAPKLTANGEKVCVLFSP